MSINPLATGLPTGIGAAGGATFPWGTIASLAIPMLLDLLMPKSKQEKEYEANLARILATTGKGYDYYTELIGDVEPMISRNLIKRLGLFKDWGFPQQTAQPSAAYFQPALQGG